MDKEKLLSPRLPTRTVPIDGLGDVVVRALTRAQALYLRTIKDDQIELEVAILRLGLADPVLSADEAAAYHDLAGVDEVADIIDAIKDLSGLAEGAPKSGVPGAGGG